MTRAIHTQLRPHILAMSMIALFVLIGCDIGVMSDNNRIEAEAEGLTVLLKPGIEPIALDYTEAWYHRQIQASVSPRGIGKSLESLATDYEQLLMDQRYPDFTDPEWFYTYADIIRDDFGIEELSGVDTERIQEIYMLQIRYDFFRRYVAPAIARTPRSVYGLNALEIALLAVHPWQIVPTENATTAASAEALARFPGQNPGLTRVDAFRHAYWNCLIAKYAVGDKNKLNWAKLFTDAHENGSPSEIPYDNEMDLHNNGVGRTYFGSVSSESGALFWYKFQSPSETTIGDYLQAKTSSAVQIANSSSFNTGELVYIQ